MNGTSHLPSIEDLKVQAKRLRARLEADGQPVGHSRSLELVAHQYGFKNWNTLHAAVGNRPPVCPVVLGQQVRGSYLGQAFTGEVIGVQTLSAPGRYRITLLFDDPVDVVTFESFSAFRRRVTCTIDSQGTTAEKTSNGQSHLSLDL